VVNVGYDISIETWSILRTTIQDCVEFGTIVDYNVTPGVDLNDDM
jgi:hypothetical protein